MGLFSFTQEIAIDLGTANTIIMCDDKIVIDEPSVVAISMADNKMVYGGQQDGCRRPQGTTDDW